MECTVVWLLSTPVLFKNNNTSFCTYLLICGAYTRCSACTKVKVHLAGVGSPLPLCESRDQTGEQVPLQAKPELQLFIELDSTRVTLRSIPMDSSREPWTFSPAPLLSFCPFAHLCFSVSLAHPHRPLCFCFDFLFLYLNPLG